MAGDARRPQVAKTVTRFREAAHERFRQEPGTAEHEDAADREIESDHEFADVIPEEIIGTWPGA